MKTLRTLVSASIAFGLLSTSSPVRVSAEEKPAQERGRWVLTNMLAARLNPLGLFNQSQFGYQYSLSESEDPLFKGTYAKLAFAPSLSPAFGRWGLLAEVMPVSVLRLSVLGEYVTHFGTFGTLQSFSNPTADFSDAKLKELRNSTDTAVKNYSSSGTAVTFGALLQGKVGDYAARINYRAIYQNTKVRSGDTAYYDILLDVLAPKEGWIHTADTDVLRLDGDWTYGLRHTFVSTSYGAQADSLENAPTHRLGALISKKLESDPNSRISSPSVFLLTQWWLKHRFRTGAASSAALPLIALGYSFSVDFK